MSGNLKKLIHKAEKLRTQNKPAEALSVYKKICNIDKKNPAAWMAYGSTAGNIGKLDEAEYAFKKACQLSPEYGRQHEHLVQVLELQKKYEQAIAILKNIGASSIGKPVNLSLKIGVIYGKSGNYVASIKWFHQHLKTNVNDAFAFFCLASAYEATEDFDNAEHFYRSAIALNQTDFQLYNNYGALLHKLGKFDVAITQYQHSIKLNNQYPVSFYNLASIYYLLGKYQEATKLFSTSLQLKSDYIEAIVGLGKCRYSMNANQDAIELFEKAIKLDNRCHDAYANMCHTYIALGDFYAAEKAIQKAIELAPGNVETKCTVAQLHEKQGEFNKAKEIIRELLVSDPHHVDVVLTYSSLCKEFNECDKAIDLINEIVSDISITPIKKTTLHYSAGKILDKLRSYSEAFKHFEAANRLQSFNNDKPSMYRSLEDIKTQFSKTAMETLPRNTALNESPIFIVGMPRSGTTLAEQIIASHHDVYGAGELPYLDKISKRINDGYIVTDENGSRLKNITSTLLTVLAEQYIKDVGKTKTKKTRFTDKMPHNFMLIGLISIIFPKAKIIHCTRNPIDNCLSIYFSQFNSSHPYANYLEDLSEYYTDFYQNLMTHWRSVDTIPIYELNYEDLVYNQQEITRDLLTFCNLEWDENCLDFHKSKRKVATISYDQVRQPIYKGSISRWKNYEEYITPILKHFQEYI